MDRSFYLIALAVAYFLNAELAAMNKALTTAQLKKSIHLINPTNDEENCLDCTVEGYNWLLTQTSVPAAAGISERPDITLRNYYAVVQHPKIKKLVRERPGTFTDEEWENRRDYLCFRAMNVADFRSYVKNVNLYSNNTRPGALLLPWKDDDDTSHVATFYVFKHGSSVRVNYVDAQLKQVLGLEEFMNLIAEYYSDRIFIWDNSQENRDLEDEYYRNFLIQRVSVVDEVLTGVVDYETSSIGSDEPPAEQELETNMEVEPVHEMVEEIIDDKQQPSRADDEDKVEQASAVVAEIRRRLLIVIDDEASSVSDDEERLEQVPSVAREERARLLIVINDEDDQAASLTPKKKRKRTPEIEGFLQNETMREKRLRATSRKIIIYNEANRERNRKMQNTLPAKRKSVQRSSYPYYRSFH